MPAGSSRALRLDPFSLPARFAASDAAADERVRHVELYRERVVVRRSLAGMRMALNMPVSAFAGVAIRVMAGEGDEQADRLRHARTQRSLRWRCRCLPPARPTRPSPNGAPGPMCWACRCWSPRTTACCASRSRAWAVCASNECARAAAAAARSSAAAPSMPLRRMTGKLTEATPVHRGEREIIARN